MHLLSTDQTDPVLIFARQVQGKMNGTTFEHKQELIKRLNVRVTLVRDDEVYRIDMTCDLPESDYAEVIRRKSTRRNFCIRVSASMLLPRRNNQSAKRLLAEQLFTSLKVIT